MADSTRETIIKAFLTRAATITTGYNVPMGANVYRATKDVDPSCLPAIIIWPQPEATENREFGKYLLKMPVKVEAISLFGTSNPSVIAEQMLADLRKAFMGTTTMSALIENIQYSGGGTDDYPDAEHLTVGAYALFTVTYFSTISNPYA
jgi:hypothetical protein